MRIIYICLLQKIKIIDKT
ncbi:hypothetical protein ECEC1865_1394, partial [Escherichia coli EC1865]